MENLDMHRVTAEFVPWLLTNEQAFLTKMGTSHSTTTVLAGSSTYRYFPVSQAAIHLERTKI
jgi:dihydrofolate reductase